MVRSLLLAALLSLPSWGWELTVVFTTDLHASLSRLEGFREFFAQADLVLDGGDAWEDTHRLTGEAEAWETMRGMAGFGYTAMVLGNHETYLGPKLFGRILAETPFAVLATNLRSSLPTTPWALVEAKGLRILILGVLWDLAVIWPGWELRDPQEAVEETLRSAPPHDLFLLLGHMDTSRALELARRLSQKPALFILGHDHEVYEKPFYVEGVPIVQAGSRGKTLGFVRLGPQGVCEYKTITVSEPKSLPTTWLPLAVVAFLLFVLPAFPSQF
ncbi:MAG: metallophosphoesterase [Candidatus Bipolaricaulota bacterium]|nr:metallophosphoesterase [Candidatus Bipolaricaulota bacterium]MDW8126439.1 metallophosphoesterase [Candidatus Bipolaricaulota bacterium]